MWKTNKKNKDCSLRKEIKLQREVQALLAAAITAGLHR